MTSGADRPKATRGTSNKNVSGSAEDRRRRRAWLLLTYAADRDLHPLVEQAIAEGHEAEVLGLRAAVMDGVPLGEGVKACRCYRCGRLLTLLTMTVDRILPGCMGGTYRRTNIRPACAGCNSETGGALSGHRKRAKKRSGDLRA